jgi:hypothetical protein
MTKITCNPRKTGDGNETHGCRISSRSTRQSLFDIIDMELHQKNHGLS